MKLNKSSYNYRGDGPAVTTEVEEAYRHCAQIVRNVGYNCWVHNPEGASDPLVDFIAKTILAHLAKKRTGKVSTRMPYKRVVTVVDNTVDG